MQGSLSAIRSQLRTSNLRHVLIHAKSLGPEKVAGRTARVEWDMITISLGAVGDWRDRIQPFDPGLAGEGP